MQGYKRFGINRANGATTYREWAPAAQAAWLIGDFNQWQGTEMKRDEFGVWAVRLRDNPDGSGAIPHKSRVKVRLQRHDGSTIDLVPAWIRYTHMPQGHGSTFDGVHWDPPARERHRWCATCFQTLVTAQLVPQKQCRKQSLRVHFKSVPVCAVSPCWVKRASRRLQTSEL